MILSAVTNLVNSNPISMIVVVFAVVLIILVINYWRKEKWTCLMIIATAACIIFLAYPLMLSEVGFAYEAADTYFSGLGVSDYKSSFLESIGGMLGTFLAITGALWTQHYFEQEQERKEDIENSTVVYYDFKFAFTEIKEKLEDCAKDHSATPEQITTNMITGTDLHHRFTGYRIQIDSKWIKNVAKLPYEFSSDEIEHIYYIYGLINSINLTIEIMNSNEIMNSVAAEQVKEKLCEFYAVSPLTCKCTFNNEKISLDKKKELTISIYEKLEQNAKQRQTKY